MSSRFLPHVTPALAESARQLFQPRYSEPQSPEDGREMAANLLGVFGLLAEWREAKRASVPARSGSTVPREPARHHSQE